MHYWIGPISASASARARHKSLLSVGRASPSEDSNWLACAIQLEFGARSLIKAAICSSLRAREQSSRVLHSPNSIRRPMKWPVRPQVRNRSGERERKRKWRRPSSQLSGLRRSRSNDASGASVDVGCAVCGLVWFFRVGCSLLARTSLFLMARHLGAKILAAC